MVGVAFKLFHKVDVALARIDDQGRVLKEHEQFDNAREERLLEVLEKGITFGESRHKFALEMIDKQHRVAIDGISAANTSSKERFDMTMKAISSFASRADNTFSQFHGDLTAVRAEVASIRRSS